MPQTQVDVDFIIGFLVKLLRIPSPTGDTERAITFVQETLAAFPLQLQLTAKGALTATWKGRSAYAPRALTAHVDTLGAMVKEIKRNGRLKLAQIGGYAWEAIEGETCTIVTTDGQHYRGTILPTKASVHVYGKETHELERKGENMEVRLDARTTSVEETRSLGIEVGDFVYLDPRVEVTDTGFVRSRHLDDKAGVACIIGAVKVLSDAGLSPAQRTTIHVSNYEEVGHGASSGIPEDATELLAVDMAAVGEGQNSDEFTVSICAQDSGGPYHIAMRRKLVRLAQERNIPYKVDIYPFYRSDGEAAWRAGANLRVGLIGPGVDASHAYERTHRDSLEATTRLIVAYLLDEAECP
ncbi:MAG TPA: M42 family peptidase, partial [Anaerolineae bacterium]|nr:M42 family peptidase [Anaerolineae bacterium]HIQ06549.1 M42 family peptidase [Anaerolineae bacterium]